MNRCVEKWRYGSALALGLLLVGLSVPAAAQLAPLTAEEQICGPLRRPDRVPPMDYRNDRKLLTTVEWGHFRPQVENLIKPMFDAFGSDLDYTLHAYPNHPRALMTMMRLGERDKTEQPKGLTYTIECFFRRAITFRSDDLLVRMIYAQYLNNKGRTPDAMAQLDYVVASANDNAFTHYNAGLIYFDINAFDKALAQAHRAAEMGFGRPELKEKLVKAGKWHEPTPTPSAEAAAPAAAASATPPTAAASAP